MNPEDLRGRFRAFIEQVGNCPYSQNDTVEAMVEGDCMCVCLQVTRTEAAIQDPTRLQINSVIPTFMSLNMFMESSMFNLQKNQDAGGGFDLKKQGELALAAGREPITGVFPIFLFKEHWKIANLKLQQLLGFLTTCDPLGYNLTQRFVVPFLILQKAVSQAQAQPSEAMMFAVQQLT